MLVKRKKVVMRELLHSNLVGNTLQYAVGTDTNKTFITKGRHIPIKKI